LIFTRFSSASTGYGRSNAVHADHVPIAGGGANDRDYLLRASPIKEQDMSHIAGKPVMIVFLFCSFLLTGPACLHGQTTEKIPFQKYETLEEIRYKIDYNGYKFTVDHNWIYDMPVNNKEQLFSSRQSAGSFGDYATPEDIGPLSEKLNKVDLPASLDWRNRNGHSYISPVRNQGDCNSCYAFAAAAAAEGAYNVAMGKYDGNRIYFSEAYIMWCLGSREPYSLYFHGCREASWQLFEMQALVDIGIGYEKNFPYDTLAQQCTHWQEPRVKFQSWYRIPCNDINAIKTAIMVYGPVNASVRTTDAFQSYKEGIYDDDNTYCGIPTCYDTKAGHAVALIGWNDNGDPDNEGYWILRNSMGTEWGEQGYEDKV
jgi:C1A family cysteine protease